MKRLALSWALGILVATLHLGVARAQASSATATVSSWAVKATLTRETNPSDFRLLEYFSTTDPQHQSVVCASGFVDVEYILRDASGHVVEGAKDPWKAHSDRDYPMSFSSKGPSNGCTTVGVAGAARVVYVSWLYPNLKPGTYTLEIILAPRGIAGRAALAPFTIDVH
jgi:hypothetical protein